MSDSIEAAAEAIWDLTYAAPTQPWGKASSSWAIGAQRRCRWQARAVLSSLFQGEGREGLVEAMARAIAPKQGFSYDHLPEGDGREYDQASFRIAASAALDALAHHLLGEQKPDE